MNQPDAVHLVRDSRTHLKADGRLRGRTGIPLDQVGLTKLNTSPDG